MTNSEDFSIQNFQLLIQNYEAALKDVTGELDSVQNEQKILKNALCENNQLRSELEKKLSENAKAPVKHSFQESDFVDNLQLQLKAVGEEKEQVVKLWQNASNTVEELESELRIYQDNTDGFVPKSKLLQISQSYEEKIKDLESTLNQTKSQLNEALASKSKELLIKDREITGTLQSHDNTLKIIKNLEEEVLSLQQRLNEANGGKRQLEDNIKTKNEKSDLLKVKMKECTLKVEEALDVVDIALSEKDAALLREAQAKEEAAKLTETLNNFIDETNENIKIIKEEYEAQVRQIKEALSTTQDLVKIKDLEVENFSQKCAMLESEMKKIKNYETCIGDSPSSKILVLEKNLENTFQKLLLSEKQNIQLKSEIESIKNDLTLMSQHYERDINLREAEKMSLRNETVKLKTGIEAMNIKLLQSETTIHNLNEQLNTLTENFREQMKETQNAFQQTCIERQEMEAVQTQIVQELKEQLFLQTEINKKWRTETKTVTEQLEKVISGLKGSNKKLKFENKMLCERLKDANLKMFEYRKFLEMISHDVSKITTITLPEVD